MQIKAAMQSKIRRPHTVFMWCAQNLMY